MKFYFTLFLFFVFTPVSLASAASTYDGYMEGHPSYNSDYYTPDYNRNSSTPNYDSDYYNKTYNYNNSYSGYSDESNKTPHGNDIRDYNPYYDRDGNLK